MEDSTSCANIDLTWINNTVSNGTLSNVTNVMGSTESCAAFASGAEALSASPVGEPGVLAFSERF